MSTWLFEGALSVVFFLLLVPLLISPFLWLVYRRYHYPAPGPTILAAAAGLYACSLVAFTTFPLPTQAEDFCEQRALYDYWRLQPGRSFAEVWEHYQQVGLTATLTGNLFLQVAFNIVFFVPLGFLIAYALRRGILVAAASGLAVSMLIEATQGTGLWFVYPCPYRVAEFDDLMTNTTGALLGWCAGWLVSRRWPLPSAQPRPDPGPPSLGRRSVAAALDLTLVIVASFAVQVAFTAAEVSLGAWQPDTAWITVLNGGVGACLLLVVPLVARRSNTLGQGSVQLGQASLGQAPLGQAAFSAESLPAGAAAVGIRFAVRWLPILVFGTPALLVVAVLELTTIAVRADRRSLANVLARTRSVTREALPDPSPELLRAEDEHETALG